jgi:glycosyltransferase involved in cell wall biosynthesis
VNVLFLTIVKINSIEERGIYTDLLRKFRDEGHDVFVMTPTERRDKKATNLRRENNTVILQVKTFNLQKINVLEKGVATLAIEYQYLSAIKKYFSDVKFDLILYSTPPITFSKVINFIKNRDQAYSYLLLKDIFPQNAIDMKMFKENGVLHKMFKKKEKKLYVISDAIGCMSEANKTYILKNNLNLDPSKVEVNPNSIRPIDNLQTLDDKIQIKKKYNLPLFKKIFVYGGNLGKPQGVDFLLKTIEASNNPDIFYLVVGSGTQFRKIKEWFDIKQPKNAILLAGLPKSDYDKLLNACDVGLIFLHKDFTIPNFPARFLSYLEMRLPVLAATDSNSDIGQIIEENGCGKWVLHGDISKMIESANALIEDEVIFNEMKENGWKLLQKSYKVDNSYELIINRAPGV